MTVEPQGNGMIVSVDVPNGHADDYAIFTFTARLSGKEGKEGAPYISVVNTVYDVTDGLDNAGDPHPVTAKCKLPRSVKKMHADANWLTSDTNDYQIAPIPDETGEWHWNYVVEVNPWAENFDETSDTVRIVDTSGELLEMIEDSIQYVDENGNAVPSCSGEREEEAYVFTVPDEMHLFIRYSMKINISDTQFPNPIWFDINTTWNSVTLMAPEPVGYNSRVNSSSYLNSLAWAVHDTASATIRKVGRQDGQERPLAGAEFSLESVWDNLGNSYEGHEGDEVYEEYGSFTIDDATTGKITLSRLPKDRIYRLTETKCPDGYEFADGSDGTMYFFIPGKDADDLSEDKLPEFLRGKTIRTVTMDNTTPIVIYNEKSVTEEPEITPASNPDVPDTPNDTDVADDTQTPGTPQETPAPQPTEEATMPQSPTPNPTATPSSDVQSEATKQSPKQGSVTNILQMGGDSIEACAAILVAGIAGAAVAHGIRRHRTSR